MSDNIYLVYIGKGDSLPGVPARSLTKVETEQHGEAALLLSGLYRLAEKPRPKSDKRMMFAHEDKSVQDKE